ncbi:Dps family protein [Polycladidibacter hongkongensis]|uniref:Dps family protein n=1 Tax=Polycladidibacter hongkongensis TaxID=1647556 RepID=UPI00082C78FF|nr:DNA starvation/stationary phase protection protein [Pseudovibrio hongkongensis]
MEQASLGLTNSAREQTAKVLNSLLADEFVLLVKTWNCHWNIRGNAFHSQHVLLDEQYHALVEVVDDIAERVRALGGQPLGSMHAIHEHTRLKEMPFHKPLPKAQEMVSALVQDHETIVRELRLHHDSVDQRQHDVGTISLMEDLILKHEKMAWFLRAHLDDEEGQS